MMLFEIEEKVLENSKADLEKYFGTYDIDQVNEEYFNNVYNINQR